MDPFEQLREDQGGRNQWAKSLIPEKRRASAIPTVKSNALTLSRQVTRSQFGASNQMMQSLRDNVTRDCLLYTSDAADE